MHRTGASNRTAAPSIVLNEWRVQMLQEVVQEINKTAQGALMDDLHTAIPGRIISVNGAKATVQPLGQTKTSDGKMMDYPQLPSVPIVMPISSSGGIGVAYPVKAGDSCLLIISEVELDAWRTGAKAQGSLRFDLSNAVCLPGLLNYCPAAVASANSSGSVVISGNVLVNGSLTVSGDVNGGGISLKSHTHNCPDGGGTSGAPQ